ncbi:ADP-ribose glycohydrolase OARD1 isoform X2 [Neoarius graeffei]|uniref:ADP-ribose glycohydrolase OARD1 isoform X2 n=1 Tax=Neoarius graeffei TaxID=443677 RepID=UPI00298C2778|nr:ADP-ribose glycohydrolase OARD1 isoform X2 [Neoarius graeffei]
MGSKLRYVKGDLFSCPSTHSLAHCISMDCKMGAGIAVLFKKKFGGVEELLAQQRKPGECAVLKRGFLALNPVATFGITKQKYNQKPTYETLRQSLEAMKVHCVENGVTKLSIPRIGCGLDRLTWDNVSVIVEEVFQPTDVAVTVYSL